MKTHIAHRSTEEILLQIKAIKELDLKTVEYKNVFDQINQLMREYRYLPFPADQKTVHRARINKKNQLFEYKKNLWAPMPSDMKPNVFNRANCPKKPMFYCSNFKKTVFVELPI